MSKKVLFSIIFLSAVLILALGWLVDERYLAVGRYLASQAEERGDVGVNAKVTDNPINNLFKRLKDKELALNVKEGELQTAAARFEEKLGRQTKIVIILAATSGVLLAAVFLNFYLDSKRKKWEERQHKK